MALIGESNRTVLIAGLIAVLAISTSAATIDSAVILNPGAVQTGPDTEQTGQQLSPPISNSEAVSEGGTPESGATADWSIAGIQLTTCIRFLATPFGILAGLGSFVFLLYGVLRTRGARSASLAGYALGPVWFFGYFLMTDCSTGNPVVRNAPVSSIGGQSLSAPAVSPLIVAAGFGIVTVLTGVLLYAGMGDEPEFSTPTDEEGGRSQAEELAEAAGRAADQISERDVPVDNAVYEAWYEMTRILDEPDPETSTPGEFADAAIEAGMDADSVSELTRLFDEVRYGDMDASEREESAVALLRRIESKHTEPDAKRRETSMGSGDAGNE